MRTSGSALIARGRVMVVDCHMIPRMATRPVLGLGRKPRPSRVEAGRWIDRLRHGRPRLELSKPWAVRLLRAETRNQPQSVRRPPGHLTRPFQGSGRGRAVRSADPPPLGSGEPLQRRPRSARAHHDEGRSPRQPASQHRPPGRAPGAPPCRAGRRPRTAPGRPAARTPRPADGGFFRLMLSGVFRGLASPCRAPRTRL
jgi:hypothetical protein